MSDSTNATAVVADKPVRAAKQKGVVYLRKARTNKFFVLIADPKSIGRKNWAVNAKYPTSAAAIAAVKKLGLTLGSKVVTQLDKANAPQALGKK